ncbi:MAG: hypothetical protein WC250_03165, partial [Candidatus Paceibacterota bacterium]
MKEAKEEKSHGAEEAAGLNQINELERSLYSRKQKTFSIKRRPIMTSSSQGRTVGSDWEHGSELPTPKTPKAGLSLSYKIFIGAVIFFLVAIFTAVFVFTGGSNVVSNNKIDLNIAGPASIAGGEKLALNLSMGNNNSTTLEDADLIVEYPSGARNPNDLNTELKRARISVGNISAGQVVNQGVESVLFGEENSKQMIKFTLEYRVAGSNAIFYKEKVYDIVISSAPVTVQISSLTEANAGQDVAVSVTVASNSTETLRGVMLSADYPFGFTYKNASPDTSYGKNTWLLGDLAPQSKRTVSFSGTIDGQDGEEKVFRFDVGAQSLTDEKIIGAVFLSVPQTVAIKKPFIGINLSLNGETGDLYATKAGRLIRGDLVWQNNTSEKITALAISVKLDGSALDRSSVSAERGFYRSSDNTIVWDASTVDELNSVEPGGTGRLSFGFSALPTTSSFGSPLINPEISVIVGARGFRSGENNVPEAVDSSLTKRVRVNSNLALISNLYYYSGPFTNTGPLPPKADQETTYTVVWTLNNPTNAVSNVKVTTALPPYVRFVGKVDPDGSDVSFNQLGGQVVW